MLANAPAPHPSRLTMVAVLIALFACASSPAAQGVPPKKNAHGTLTVAGKSTPLNYAYAIQQRKNETLLLLSDQPLAGPELNDVFARSRRADAGEIHTLEMTLNADKQPITVSVRHTAFGMQWGGGSTEDTFDATTFDQSTVAGRVYRKSAGEFNGVAYSYDATFMAALQTQPPPTFAGEAAKNSAPAKAAIAFLKAGMAGDVPTIKSYMVKEAIPQLDGPDGKQLLEMLKLGPDPATTPVTQVTVKGNTAEVVFEQKTEDSEATTTITLKMEDGTWKVDPR